MSRGATHALGAVVLAYVAGCAKHVYPDGRGLAGQLEREVVALHQRVRALEGELSDCAHGGDPGPIYAELHQIFGSTEITVERRGGITVVTLPNAHLFADPLPGREPTPIARRDATIVARLPLAAPALRTREEATMTLDLLATALKLHPNQRVVVEGHTDDRMLPGAVARRFGSHLDLSFHYAAAVTRALTDEFGVAADRFTVAGRGHWAPIATNDTQSGQARNQRVEVHIYPPSSR